MTQAKKQLPASPLSSNQTNAREQAVLNEGGIRCASCSWSFSADGGAQTTYSFGRKLPAGAIVKRVTADESTPLAGGSTIQLKADSTDITTAESFAGTGVQELTLDAADGVKISAESELSAEIATADATAGSIRWFVEYLLPND